MDAMGNFSLNDFFDMIGGVFNSLTDKLLDYLNSLVVFGENSIQISTTLISVAGVIITHSHMIYG